MTGEDSSLLTVTCPALSVEDNVNYSISCTEGDTVGSKCVKMCKKGFTLKKDHRKVTSF